MTRTGGIVSQDVWGSCPRDFAGSADSRADSSLHLLNVHPHSPINGAQPAIRRVSTMFTSGEHATCEGNGDAWRWGVA